MSQINNNLGNVAYYLAQLSSTTSANGTDTTNNVTLLEAVSSTQNATTPAQPITASSAGGTSSTSPIQDLRSQLESAVTTALNNLSPSSSPSDVISAVRDAVKKTLQANGINPDSTTTKGAGGHHHHHSHGGGGASAAGGSSGASGTSSAGGTSSASGSSGTDSDGDSDGSGSSSATSLLQALGATPTTTSSSSSSGGGSSGASTSASNPQTIGDVLTNLVRQLDASVSASGNTSDPTQQLQNPLLAAIAGGGGGQGANFNSLFAQLFQGFPNGSGVDVNA